MPASQPLLCFPVALTAMGMTSIMLPRPIYFENSGVDYNWYVKTSVTNGIHVGRYDAYEEGMMGSAARFVLFVAGSIPF